MMKLDYDSNGIAKVFENGKWYLTNREGQHLSEGYTYIEAWGEGYYKAELGVRKNLLRPDGSVVLKVWHHDVYKVHHGLFVFSNTKRKSKYNPKTRYTYGVAHVNGDVIFPMIFNWAYWMEDADYIYAEIDERPYVVTTNGSIYDLGRNHLPKQAKDNFPFRGVKGTVCEGCLYASDIRDAGEGCGRLFTQDFRNRYLKGRCEYRKTDPNTLSRFEETEQFEKEQAKEKLEKSTNVYALRLVREFINERLDGDIDKLRDFDLFTLKDDEKYGKDFCATSELGKSILSLVFANSWPDLTVDSINRREYRCSTLISSQNVLGSNIMDEYFTGMQNFCPNKEQFERALRVAHQLYSIGNLWVLPGKRNDKATLTGYMDIPKFRGYIDRYLKALQAVFLNEKQLDMHLKGVFYKNRKVMTEYQGAEGWQLFINNMMLQIFVDEDYQPKELFDYIWHYMKGLDRESYFRSVDKFCTFCEEAIPRRAEQMIKVLKRVLSEE